MKRYREIAKLSEELHRRGIEHTFDRCYDGWQIVIPGVIDFVEHQWSYGHEVDLMEARYLSGENAGAVVGHLNVQNALEMIE